MDDTIENCRRIEKFINVLDNLKITCEDEDDVRQGTGLLDGRDYDRLLDLSIRRSNEDI